MKVGDLVRAVNKPRDGHVPIAIVVDINEFRVWVKWLHDGTVVGYSKTLLEVISESR